MLTAWLTVLCLIPSSGKLVLLLIHLPMLQSNLQLSTTNTPRCREWRLNTALKSLSKAGVMLVQRFSEGQDFANLIGVFETILQKVLYVKRRTRLAHLFARYRNSDSALKRRIRSSLPAAITARSGGVRTVSYSPFIGLSL